MARVFGLSSLIKALKAVCKAIDIFGAPVRAFVPEGSLSTYDAALAAIKANCELIRAIDFIDDITSTNPLWGDR